VAAAEPSARDAPCCRPLESFGQWPVRRQDVEGARGFVSEYQYYEFVALDRPLTVAEMAELRSISTRAQITPTRFFNEYQWGDLKADPAELLASLTPLRAELLRGDRRVAYLAWLLAVQAGELDPDTPEPRVPHGLGAPSASLAALTGFLRVDPDLLAAAAEGAVEDTSETERFRDWVARSQRGSSSGGCCGPPTTWTWRWARRGWVSSAGHIRRWPPSRAAPSRSCLTAPRNGGASPSDRGLRPRWQTSGATMARQTGSPRS
jgi:hypothetical protein